MAHGCDAYRLGVDDTPGNDPGTAPGTGPVVVGFDLDMTLVDSRPGIVDALHALADEVGGDEASVLRDDTLLVTLLRSTLDRVLTECFGPARGEVLADRYRTIYADVGVRGTTLLPGADTAVAHVRGRGGRVVVVTAKYEPNARRCLDHVGLAVDAVHGWLHGPEKAAALRAEGAHLYVGDTTSDMDAARHADAIGLGVASGTHDPEHLTACGAVSVLGSLEEFVPWWHAAGVHLGLPG